MKLQDSVALVTGGNRGIGEAFVRAFVAAGARRVYAACRRRDDAAHLVKEALIALSRSSSMSPTPNRSLALHANART